jgi:O-antigen/teichoic acid export membrane protein
MYLIIKNKILEFIKSGVFVNLRNSFLYFGGSIVQMFIAIFTSPIFAKHLEPSDFAIIGYYGSVSAFFFPLFYLALNQYYLINYFKQNEEENRKALNSIILFLTITSSSIYIIGVAAIYFYFVLTHVEIPIFPFCFIILGSLFFDIYRTFLLIDLKIKKEALKYFLVSLVFVVLNTSLSLLFVVKMNMGATGKLLGVLVIQGIIAFYAVKALKIKFKGGLDMSFIKKAAPRMSILLISSYIFFPIVNLDRILLERLKNVYELGFYSVGLNLAVYFNTFTNALLQAFQPDFFKFSLERNTKKLLIYFGVFMSIILVFLITFLIFSPEITGFLTSHRYTRAYSYANYLSIGFAAMNVFYFLDSVIMAIGEPKKLLYIYTIGAICSIVIYIFNISKFGFFGATYAKIYISIVLVIIQLLFLRNIIRKHYEKNNYITTL